MGASSAPGLRPNQTSTIPTTRNRSRPWGAPTPGEAQESFLVGALRPLRSVGFGLPPPQPSPVNGGGGALRGCSYGGGPRIFLRPPVQARSATQHRASIMRGCLPAPCWRISGHHIEH